jgi:23S rRNA (adenine2503-C2)-methyltransferase
MEAVKQFPVNARKRVMFEYLVIKDVNDGIDAAKKLIKLLHGIKAKVNLIYFNPYGGTDFKRPEEKEMIAFQDYLTQRGLHCTIRESKGLDISAACGQLREQNQENNA